MIAPAYRVHKVQGIDCLRTTTNASAPEHHVMRLQISGASTHPVTPELFGAAAGTLDVIW